MFLPLGVRAQRLWFADCLWTGLCLCPHSCICNAFWCTLLLLFHPTCWRLRLPQACRHSPISPCRPSAWHSPERCRHPVVNPKCSSRLLLLLIKNIDKNQTSKQKFSCQKHPTSRGAFLHPLSPPGRSPVVAGAGSQGQYVPAWRSGTAASLAGSAGS